METVVLDPFIVALIGGSLIPILTGIVTKLRSSTGVKAGVALVLSAAVGVAGQVVTNDGELEPKLALLAFATAFAANVTSYLGVHKAIGKPVPILATATANFGIGK